MFETKHSTSFFYPIAESGADGLIKDLFRGNKCWWFEIQKQDKTPGDIRWFVSLQVVMFTVHWPRFSWIFPRPSTQLNQIRWTRSLPFPKSFIYVFSSKHFITHYRRCAWRQPEGSELSSMIRGFSLLPSTLTTQMYLWNLWTPYSYWITHFPTANMFLLQLKPDVFIKRTNNPSWMRICLFCEMSLTTRPVSEIDKEPWLRG